MQCVILAAGEGSRMRPLTSSRPKVMLPLVGKPMLEHLIRNVRDAGIKEIIIVVGYKEEAIREYFGDGRSFGVSITYVVQRKQLGTADALRTAEPFITDTFLMLNGDMVVEIGDLQKICRTEAPVMAVTTPKSCGWVVVVPAITGASVR